MQNNEQAYSSATGEVCEVIRSYIITREVDSLSADFESELELLMRKYDFNLNIENFPTSLL